MNTRIPFIILISFIFYTDPVFCQCTNVALGKSATASASDAFSGANNAIDGDCSTEWNSDQYPSTPQWIQIDLQNTFTINNINLLGDISPSGNVFYRIYTSPDMLTWTQVDSIVQYEVRGQLFQLNFSSQPLTNVRGVKVQSVEVLSNLTPSWVAWYEIGVFSVSSETAPTITSGGPLTFCQNDSVTLTSSSGASYLWSTGATTQSITVKTSGSYCVTVGETASCIGGTESGTVCTSGSACVQVIVDPGPVVTVVSSTNTCEGKSDGAITIDTTGGTGLRYKWNNGPTTADQNNLVPGSYTVTVSDVNGCSDTASAKVLQLQPSVIMVGRDTVIKMGGTAQLFASGGTSYQWTPSGSLSDPDIYNPIADPTQTTTYTVLVTGANECPGSGTVTITVEEDNCDSSSIFIPSAFSPNGDVVNDVLYVRGKSTCINQFTFRIFDRWGELVFETTNISNGWDGTFRGKRLETGVFVYLLSANLSSGQTVNRNGNITLLR